MGNRWGNSGNSGRFYFFGLQNHCGGWLQLQNKKTLAPRKKSYDKPRKHNKKQRHYFAYKGSSSKVMVFPVVMYGCHVWKLDHKEGWAPKNWCFWTVLLEKTLEALMDCKEIKPVHPKGNQFWIFTGRTDAEAEAPIFGPPDVKSQLTGKDTDPGLRLKIGGEEGDRGWDGWMASLTQWTWIWTTPGDGEGQGSLTCCSPWGCKSWTQLSNWTTNSVCEITSSLHLWALFWMYMTHQKNFNTK